MPFPEDTDSSTPRTQSSEQRLQQSKEEYYLRLAAKALYHCPHVKAVDGVPNMHEVWGYIDSQTPYGPIEDVLWLFGTEPDYVVLRNTTEYGLVQEVSLTIRAENVVHFDTSESEEYGPEYDVEAYIEDNLVDGRTEEDSLYETLPEPPEDMDTYTIAHHSTPDFRDYHPTLDGELTRDVRAQKQPGGKWKARYNLVSATAATPYSALRKALDYYHRDGLGPSSNPLQPADSDVFEALSDDSEEEEEDS